MKMLIPSIILLMLSHLLMADVMISGIDFAKSKSIASVLKGINQTRGSQNVVLSLDRTRKLKFIDATNYPGCPFSFSVGVDGIRMPADKTRLTRNEFIQRLKKFAKISKEQGSGASHIQIFFDDDISGIEGLRLLKDICDSGISGILCMRQVTKEEALQLKRAALPKPSPPK